MVRQLSFITGILLGGLMAATGSIMLSTPEPPAPAPAPVAQATEERSASVVVNGDLLWHENVYNSGRMPDGTWDYSEVFAPMAEIISEADLAICHKEVPLAPPEGPFSGYPDFSAPPQTVEGVAAAGYDMCTTASNHSVDAGFAGIERTTSTLDAAGLQHVGMARSPEEAAAPVIHETADGVRIGVITGTYGTNGIPVPEPWMVPDLHPEALLERAAATRAAGADIILAAIHAGDEGATQPNAQQTELAEILTASADVDVVYMHHAHAVQPIAQVNGKWVIYGLGNYLANQLANDTLAYDGADGAHAI